MGPAFRDEWAEANYPGWNWGVFPFFTGIGLVGSIEVALTPSFWSPGR